MHKTEPRREGTEPTNVMLLEAQAGSSQGKSQVLLPKAEGLRRLGLKKKTWLDWSNPKSPRFKATLPRLRRLENSRASFFLESEVDDFVNKLFDSDG